MKQEIFKYIIKKETDAEDSVSAQIISYGPYVRSLHVPVRLGEVRSVVLGFAQTGRYPRYLPAVHWECLSHDSCSVRFACGDETTAFMADKMSIYIEGTHIPAIYFNLMGHGVLNVLDHRLYVKSGSYAGEGGREVLLEDDIAIKDREGRHPLDFSSQRILGETIRMGHPQLTKHHGYDTEYILSGEGPAARLTDFYHELTLEVHTDAERLRVETANGFSGNEVGVGGCIYPVHGGIQLTPLAEEGRTVRVEYRFRAGD